jgi:hypothetical protein
VGTNGNLLVDGDVMETVLSDLTQISATSYVTYNPRDLKNYGLDQPMLALHISLSGTNQLGRVLLIGDVTSVGNFAIVQGRDVVFLIL